MYRLEGKNLNLDTAFTTSDGTQYPSNWLRYASPSDRAAIGVTEVAAPPWYDQKFFWGPNNPKDHTQLVENWVSKVKATAGSMLAQTDWMIVRSSDPSSGKVVPDEITTARQLIRDKSDEKEAAILATETTEELAAYVTSPGFTNWQEQEEQPPVDMGTTSTVISFDMGTTSAGIV